MAERVFIFVFSCALLRLSLFTQSFVAEHCADDAGDAGFESCIDLCCIRSHEAAAASENGIFDEAPGAITTRCCEAFANHDRIFGMQMNPYLPCRNRQERHRLTHDRDDL